MAADVHRMFGCPVCGYRIGGTEPVCPRCNNKFDRAMKLECPFCGELVDPRAKVCPVCHVDYHEFREKTKRKGSDSNIDDILNEIIKLESTEVKEAPKKFSCPNCSWLLDGSESKCPKCGKSLEEDEYAFQCPICGSPVPSDAIVCPECGIPFEKHEAEGPPARPAAKPPSVKEAPAQPERRLEDLLDDLASSFRKAPEVDTPKQETPRPPERIEEVAPAPRPPPPPTKPPVIEVPEEENVPPKPEAPVAGAPVKRKRKLKSRSGA